MMSAVRVMQMINVAGKNFHRFLYLHHSAKKIASGKVRELIKKFSHFHFSAEFLTLKLWRKRKTKHKIPKSKP